MTDTFSNRRIKSKIKFESLYSFLQDGTDFYMKEDCRRVRSPPPRPPTVEKTSGSTLTITQLESLRQQLYIVAPSGAQWRGRFVMRLLIFLSIFESIISTIQASCPVLNSPVCWGGSCLLTWVETPYLSPGSTLVKHRFSSLYCI